MGNGGGGKEQKGEAQKRGKEGNGSIRDGGGERSEGK